MTRFCKSGIVAASALAVCAAAPATAQFLGPSEYRQRADSPFNGVNFSYFYLEDFEDGALNTPGVSLSEFAATDVALAVSDSVDGDDGVVDGFATGSTKSLVSRFRTSSFTFNFSAATLGKLPTHAGVVWTDIGRNDGGPPLPADLIDNVTFEAFGPSGTSLGVIGPFSVGDNRIDRTTAEDRFFGIVHLAGISAIRLSMPGKNNWEVDHLQYGRVRQSDPNGVVPELGTLALATTGLLPLAGALVRKRRKA